MKGPPFNCEPITRFTSVGTETNKIMMRRMIHIVGKEGRGGGHVSL
jgi:hypothetical protein